MIDQALQDFAQLGGEPFGTILADPPWRFQNRTGKVAPEHRRLARYDTMAAAKTAGLPVAAVAAFRSHLYLWVPNALVADALMVMREWGFTYKSNLVWHKVRKDGRSDGRGVGFYFRNVTELVLFGVRGSRRTLDPGRRQVNLFRPGGAHGFGADKLLVSARGLTSFVTPLFCNYINTMEAQ